MDKMELASHVLTFIAFFGIGWKLRTSKVDKNTLLPGYTLERVTRRRKTGGNIVMVIAGVYFILLMLVWLFLT